jgi:glycosyltransferase involved in cell wall biosynthesis
MARDRIVFWQQSPSPHQAPFVREIAAVLPPGRTVASFQQPPTTVRLAMGWDTADYGATEIIMSSEEGTAWALLAAEPERSVHVFSSVVHTPEIYRALRDALADPRLKIGLLSEARDWRGLKGRARTVHSFWHERRFRGRVDFVLAIGGNGVEWYRRCGYPDEKVFPFCYVVEPPGQGEADVTDARDRSQGVGHERAVHIVFVGRLIEGKGVKILLASLRSLVDAPWFLSILGDGPHCEAIQRSINQFGLQERVALLGHQPNHRVRKVLEYADLLAFPSVIDGWGAVVNEALMAGVPVICSDWCGASSVIRPGWNGDVFRSGSVDDLARVLRTWINRGKLSPGEREAIRSWSYCIAGPAIARYVLDVAAFVDGSGNARPTPPWSMAI